MGHSECVVRGTVRSVCEAQTKCEIVGRGVIGRASQRRRERCKPSARAGTRGNKRGLCVPVDLEFFHAMSRIIASRMLANLVWTASAHSTTLLLTSRLPEVSLVQSLSPLKTGSLRLATVTPNNMSSARRAVETR